MRARTHLPVHHHSISQFLHLYADLRTSKVRLGRDYHGGVQNVWGVENVPENALSRKFLDPSKRASGLLCRGFLYRKNKALTREGGGKRPVRGGSKTPFWEGCHS